MKHNTFLNIVFAITFAASLTGLMLALSMGASELVVMFIITTVMVAAAAVSTWIEK